MSDSNGTFLQKLGYDYGLIKNGKLSVIGLIKAIAHFAAIAMMTGLVFIRVDSPQTQFGIAGGVLASLSITVVLIATFRILFAALRLLEDRVNNGPRLTVEKVFYALVMMISVFGLLMGLPAVTSWLLAMAAPSYFAFPGWMAAGANGMFIFMVDVMIKHFDGLSIFLPERARKSGDAAIKD